MILGNRELSGYGNLNSQLYPQNSFRKILLSGDYGLVKTFWMYVILMGMFINIGFVMLAALSTPILAMFIVIISTLFTIPLHIAMWRAADKYKGPKIWAILTRIQVRIHLFSFVWGIILSVVFINIDSYLSHV